MSGETKDREGGAKMVLRTIYLPVEVDEKLKTTALLRQRSKNDVMRNYIVQGLRKEAEKAPPRQRGAVRVERPKRVALKESDPSGDSDSETNQPGGSRRSE